MTRFDDQTLLECFKRGRSFPKIHAPLFSFIMEHEEGSVALDLCCSTGLLGQRLRERRHRFSHVFGVEGNSEAIDRAERAGVTMPITQMIVNEDTLDDFLALLLRNRCDTIIARRCLPELFGDCISFGQTFMRSINDVGVQWLFIEGRRATSTPANALHSIEKEIELASAAFEVVEKRGAITLMGRKR